MSEDGGGSSRREASAARDVLEPPSTSALPTTAGSIALGNLSAQIDFLDGSLARHPDDARALGSVVPLLQMRAQYLGRIADAERAFDAAEAAVKSAPDKASSYVLRASTRSGMHLFAAALADLAEAEKRGAKGPDVASQRAVILEAQGDLDGALALRHKIREALPDLVNLTLEASLLGRMGKRAEAIELFRKAPDHYPSVAVFPVAWFLLQQGLFWESGGDKDRAMTFYAAALDRLPGYAHAASHLATLAPPARGIELLTPIAAASDDPEFELILAGRLEAAGRKDEAEPRLAHVRSRYAELVEKHPEAYAEHAGWFLLDDRKDPERAFALAKRNLEIRKTDRAFELAILAALAAGKRAEACGIGAGVAKLPYAGETVRQLATDACKDGAAPKP